MRNKELRYIVASYAFLLVITRILTSTLFDLSSPDFIYIAVIIISAVAVVLIGRVLYLTFCDIRNSNQKFYELWEKDDFNGCINFAKSELKKDIAKGFALNAKSNLVMAYYRIGDNEAGRELLYETKNWGIYGDNVLYFFVLDCLLSGDVKQARRYYRRLCRAGYKQKRKVQIECCRLLLDAVSGKAEDLTIQSVYPIVGEILEKQDGY